MEVIIKSGYDQVSAEAAQQVADLVYHQPNAVLGLATGSTPLGLYKELIRLHKDEGLDFSKVVTFNLDEYVGLPASHDQSYNYFMWANLLNHINVTPENVHIPNGMARDIDAYCDWYEDVYKVGPFGQQGGLGARSCAPRDRRAVAAGGVRYVACGGNATAGGSSPMAAPALPAPAPRRRPPR